MIKDYLQLALRSLTRRKLRSWLTMIGIFIGIAAVVSLIGLGEGLRVAITSQFGLLGSDTLSIQASGMNFAGPPGTAVVTPLTDDLADKIDKVDGVKEAINRYIKTGTLEFNGDQGFGIAGSMPSGKERKIIEDMVNLKAEDGRLLKDGDRRKVVLGHSFSEETSLGGGISNGDRVLVNDISYTVVGILEKKGSFFIDGSVLINDDPLLEDFGDDGSVNLIAVKLEDENMADKVKADIEKLLRKERDVKVGDEDFVVESPKSTVEALNSSLFAVQLFVYIIATISLIVGGIGIMNTMYTAVLERTKEIGIMKSIGAKNSTIFSLFFFESGLLGMVGGGVGILFGLSLAYGLAAIGKVALGSDLIQANVSPFLIVGALMFSFCVGTAAGVFPAIQASKLKPIDALRAVK